MDGIRGTPARSPARLTLAVLVVGIVWTAVIAAVPALHFHFHLPRARLAIETASATIALLTAAVAFVRASVTGPRAWWFVGSAFLLLGLNRAVFGVLVPPESLPPSLGFYIWSAGRVLAAVLLLMAGLRRFRRDPAPATVGVGIMRVAAPSLAALAAVTGALWLGGDSLPPPAGPDALHPDLASVQSDIHLVALLLGAAGTLLFMTAAFAHLRLVEGELVSIWLPPTLVLAAVSQVHTTLAPAAFGGSIATGDLLRLGFSLLLLIGIVHDVRTAYAEDREASRRLAAAYSAEQARVADMEALERAKEDFFSVLTHELMHPIVAIRGLAVTLSTRWDHLDEETRREFVQRLTAETGRLRDMAEGSMTAVHLEDSQYAIGARPELVPEIVREVAEVNEELRPRLRVDVEDGAHSAVVVADRTRLLQVIRNLLSNAAKYSDPGTPIELRVTAVDGEVLFVVSDRGPGVPQEAVTRLFGKFTRLRGPGKEQVPGSGLGLYISKKIVEAHGGRIWLETGRGEGVSVTVALPRAEPGYG